MLWFAREPGADLIEDVISPRRAICILHCFSMQECVYLNNTIKYTCVSVVFPCIVELFRSFFVVFWNFI